jgi:NADP-dependent 3-hydroxy acid dehydrogenase YdfG
MSALKIENLFGVKGYVALVTGGSSGLGFMISKVRCFALPRDQ